MCYEIIYSIKFSIYILYVRAYGDSGIFCWIDIYTIYKRYFIKKVLLNYYITLWFLLLVNIFFIVKIKITLKRNKIKNEIYEHLIKYPRLLVLFSIPTSFNVLYRIFHKNEEITAMVYMQVIFESCLGVFINVVFITSPWINQSIANIITSYRNKDSINNLMPIREVTKNNPFDVKEGDDSILDKTKKN